MGILMALLLRGTMFKGEAVPFVMELPNYRMPGAKNVGQLLWEKAKDFLQRAFTVIFFATIIIWFLQTFNLHMNVVADSKGQYPGSCGRNHCTGIPSAWFRKLEDFYCTDHRIYGKGKCGIYAFGTLWKYGRTDGSNYAGGSSKPFGLLSVVYTMCCGYCIDQERTWRKMGGICGAGTMYGCVDRSMYRASDWYVGNVKRHKKPPVDGIRYVPFTGGFCCIY